jgi:ketosteroid isomerase-like protein
MRHNLLTATLFAATLAPGGQTDEPAPEKQVAALSEQHRLAAIKGDTKALDAVLADDWVVVGPTGEVETKRQQAKKLKDRSLVFEAIDPREVKVRVHGGTAIVMGLYHIKATVNGRTVDGDFRNTGVFNKQAGTWRCVFNQVTPVAGPPAVKR